MYKLEYLELNFEKILMMYQENKYKYETLKPSAFLFKRCSKIYQRNDDTAILF